MRLRLKRFAMFAATVALPLGGVLAQSVAPADPIGPLPEAKAQQATTGDATTQAPSAEALPAPLPPPPPVWRVDQAADLLTYIQWIGREGLTPADYDPEGLDLAMRSSDPMVLAQAATDRFNKVSSDLALGHVRGDARIDWHIVDKDLDDARQRLLLETALKEDRIADALNS